MPGPVRQGAAWGSVALTQIQGQSAAAEAISQLCTLQEATHIFLVTRETWPTTAKLLINWYLPNLHSGLSYSSRNSGRRAAVAMGFLILERVAGAQGR